MIDQTSGLNSTIQSGLLYRNNSTTQTNEKQPSSEQDVARQSSQSGGDTVSLSAQAIAQYRNVAPTGAANEAQESPASENATEDASEPKRAGSIDIKA